MIKLFHKEVWAFDAEWVPDPTSGRLAYSLGEEVPDEEVLAAMWRHGGATPDNPRPYLKTVLCRVVSVAFVRRRDCGGGKVEVDLHSIPATGAGAVPEGELLTLFLGELGKRQPQLVGFNSNAADLPILMQRSLAHSLRHQEFCRRPAKPWEGIDYFVRYSDWHLDLREIVGGWGKSTPSLHEIATVCGIPGKMGTAGEDVVELWRAGDVGSIVEYNEFDALTTYLVWLRVAHLCGHFTDQQFTAEQRWVEELLERRGGEQGGAHLLRYLEQWRRLRALRDGEAVVGS